MFTGLVQARGVVQSLKNSQGLINITIEAWPFAKDLHESDSVSVNGVCQTVVKKTERTFDIQAIEVTREKTNFQFMKVGDLVNLESALTMKDPLGGHFVTGHVEAFAPISKIEKNEGNTHMWVRLPKELIDQIIPEGSIALDGVSLTVATIDSDQIMVSLIPYTLEHTHLFQKKEGDFLNIEMDLIGKYIQKLMAPYLKGQRRDHVSLD